MVRATRSKAKRTESSLDTSMAKGRAAVRPRLALSSALSFSAPATFISATQTRAPEEARPRTISSPKPWAPPVTRHTLASTTWLRRAAEPGMALVEAPRAPGPAFPAAGAAGASRRLRASSRLRAAAKSQASPPCTAARRKGRPVPAGRAASRAAASPASAPGTVSPIVALKAAAGRAAGSHGLGGHDGPGLGGPGPSGRGRGPGQGGLG